MEQPKLIRPEWVPQAYRGLMKGPDVDCTQPLRGGTTPTCEGEKLKEKSKKLK